MLAIGEFSRLTHLSVLESELDRTRAAVASLRRLLRPDPAPLDVGAYLVGPRDTAEPSAWRTDIGWPVFRVVPR